MWVLRPQPLPAEFPSQAPCPQPHPQVYSFSSSRPGPQACRSQGKGHSHQRPLHITFPTLGCVHTLPHGSLSWAPGLACSTQFFGLRAFLRISDFIAQPWASATLGTGAGPHMGPAHFAHTSLQPARALPIFHTQTWPFTLSCSPELDTDLHKDYPQSVSLALPAESDQVCCCWPWGQDQRGKGKGLGLMGEIFYKWHQ